LQLKLLFEQEKSPRTLKVAGHPRKQSRPLSTADMSADTHLQVLVMAAGAATRFGSPKQLVRIRGESLLHRAVSHANQVAGHAVTVVLGANADQLAPLLKHSPASVVINRQWSEGIASSLRLGIRSLPGSCEGVLVTLVDQAAVTSFDLQRLASAWRRQPEWLMAASYDGHTGVPAIFPSNVFADFGELRGDTGARNILLRHADRCMRIPMPTAAMDIDTPEDLLKLGNLANTPESD
jgi:molybdenum cofactor cytidylyltransferase